MIWAYPRTPILTLTWLCSFIFKVFRGGAFNAPSHQNFMILDPIRLRVNKMQKHFFYVRFIFIKYENIALVDIRSSWSVIFSLKDKMQTKHRIIVNKVISSCKCHHKDIILHSPFHPYPGWICKSMRGSSRGRCRGRGWSRPTGKCCLATRTIISRTHPNPNLSPPDGNILRFLFKFWNFWTCCP